MPRGRPRKTRDDVLMKSAEFIGWALGGIEREIAMTRARLSSLTAQANTLRARAGRGKGTQSSAASDGSSYAEAGGGLRRARKRRTMSPEARKRISEMMKKRWAERRKKG